MHSLESIHTHSHHKHLLPTLHFVPTHTHTHSHRDGYMTAAAKRQLSICPRDISRSMLSIYIRRRPFLSVESHHERARTHVIRFMSAVSNDEKSPVQLHRPARRGATSPQYIHILPSVNTVSTRACGDVYYHLHMHSVPRACPPYMMRLSIRWRLALYPVFTCFWRTLHSSRVTPTLHMHACRVRRELPSHTCVCMTSIHSHTHPSLTSPDPSILPSLITTVSHTSFIHKSGIETCIPRHLHSHTHLRNVKLHLSSIHIPPTKPSAILTKPNKSECIYTIPRKTYPHVNEWHVRDRL